MDDFYENDEPVEDVEAAFNRAQKGVTAPPWAQYKTISTGRIYNVTFTCRSPVVGWWYYPTGNG